MKNPTAESVWARCLHLIKDNITDKEFTAWFEPTRGLKLEGNVITIQIPNELYYEWIDQNYPELLRSTLNAVLGKGARLQYSIPKQRKKTVTDDQVASEDSARMPLAITNNAPTAATSVQVETAPKREMRIDPQLNANYSFENFITGESNQVACAASEAVAKNPGKTAFNPLVLFGGVGLGKTHLGQAIGIRVKDNHPEKKVLYISSEKFIQQYIDSHRSDRLNDFINFYQMIDVLIIDDVQYFSEKKGSQNVFFHIFNHLHQGGKQIVMTSDRPPVELKGFEERLQSRLKWGVQAQLGNPSYEHRLKILRSKLEKDGIEMDDEVVNYIAHSVNTNIRELEGVINSLMAQSSFAKREINLELAAAVVGQFVRTSHREISLEQIKSVVCEAMNVDIRQIESKSRKRDIVQARQLAMFFAKSMTQNSLSLIGSQIANRDHSTVLHSCKAIGNMMDTNKQFRMMVEDIKTKLNAFA